MSGVTTAADRAYPAASDCALVIGGVTAATRMAVASASAKRSRYPGSASRAARAAGAKEATSTRQAAVRGSCRSGDNWPRSARITSPGTPVTWQTCSRIPSARARLAGEAARATITSLRSIAGSPPLRCSDTNCAAPRSRAAAARSARVRLVSESRVSTTVWSARSLSRVLRARSRAMSFSNSPPVPLPRLAEDAPAGVVPPWPGSRTSRLRPFTSCLLRCGSHVPTMVAGLGHWTVGVASPFRHRTMCRSAISTRVTQHRRRGERRRWSRWAWRPGSQCCPEAARPSPALRSARAGRSHS